MNAKALEKRCVELINENRELKQALRDLHEIAEIAAETSTTRCQEALKQWEKHHLKLIKI